LDIACNNVPVFEGRTLVVTDFSGSMDTGMYSYEGKACVLGAILAKSNNADFIIFADYTKYANFNSGQYYFCYVVFIVNNRGTFQECEIISLFENKLKLVYYLFKI
jgi:hypothetical protein